MRIVGHGIDLVEIARIERLLHDHPQKFPARCFTASEHAAAGTSGPAAQFLAGRFAAKEAVLKALGTGLTGGIAWTDIEVVAEASGRPTLRLHAAAADLARRLNADQWWISISHTAGFAQASAIAVATA